MSSFFFYSAYLNFSVICFQFSALCEACQLIARDVILYKLSFSFECQCVSFRFNVLVAASVYQYKVYFRKEYGI